MLENATPPASNAQTPSAHHGANSNPGEGVGTRCVSIWILISLCIAAAVLWGADWYFSSRYLPDYAHRGEFGEMFGAVNALFTALAFAGLIFTVLLQRGQLALQQREIYESGKTQERLVKEQIAAQGELFERQKEFQEAQRQQQMEHELKLEQVRQDFEEIVEGRRKGREAETRAGFEKNILRAIRCELEAIGQVYDNGIGAQVAKVPKGQIFLIRLSITQDWFSIFNANAVHLGKVESPLARRVIGTYILLKALVEEYRINDDYVNDRDKILLALKEKPEDPFLKQQLINREGWMVRQVDRIKTAESTMRQALAELFQVLDRRDIH